MLLCATFTTLPCKAQRKLTKEKPNLEAIRDSSLNTRSRYYYPRLQELYNRNDTTMTPQEFRYYYLGYIFQEDYNPYRESRYAEYTDSLLQLNRAAVAQNDSTLKALQAKKESPFEYDVKRKALEAASLKDRREIVKYAELALKDNPYDLNTIWLLNNLLKEMKKEMSAKIWDFRLENLLGAIMSTGTGLDKENAFYVISPEHEYIVLELMGYRPVEYRDDYFAEGFDYIAVEPMDPRKKGGKNIAEGFYFNVKEPIKEYARKFPDGGAEEEEIPMD